MTSTPSSRPATLGQLLRQRLREMSRSPEQLAQELRLPVVATSARKNGIPGGLYFHIGSRLDLMLAYTFSKSIDQASSISDPLNPFNFRLTRALSGFPLA